MSYFAPYVDAAGLHTPLYQDIRDYLVTQYTGIYGQSVSQNISTTDIQSIAVFALISNDLMQLAQAVFNGMSPMTAIGVQQDSLYKLNGIARNGATFSTVTLTVTGAPNTPMNGRIAQDANGNLWDLLASFQIPAGGTINVGATCETPGQITAAINTITVRQNPVQGWTSVTNPAAAAPGTPVEADSAYRQRQTLSVVLPSQTLVNGTIAGIAAVPGVTRYGTVGVENPTGATDSYGNPPHSISMVVEGGLDSAVANAIYLNKTPGCLTNGTTSYSVTDAITGQTMNISFFRPTYVPIFVTCVTTHLTGYTTATTTAIQTAIVNYLNALQIGELLTISALYGAALAVMPDLTQPMFSITSMKAGTAVGSQGTTDIPILFNQVCQGVTVNVTVT
jgi:uncharacterized phage protein gp47/JayE